MQRMTLREAAERTSRSITTLRRYIRSGRLRAVKEVGRYGPEYFVSDEDLAHAGLETDPERGELVPLGSDELASSLEHVFRATVPLPLYQELQMKHEQLLVQYGMVRAAGLRMIELRAQLEARDRDVTRHREELGQLREQAQREGRRLRKRLRERELELEARRLETAALKEKVRGLELLTRNAVTSESIERQLSRVARQWHRASRSRSRASQQPAAAPKARETDH